MTNCNCFLTWQVGTIVMRKIRKLAEDRGITLHDAIRTILYQHVGYPGEPIRPDYHPHDERWSQKKGYIFASVDDAYVENHIYPLCEVDGVWTNPLDIMTIHLMHGALQQC